MADKQINPKAPSGEAKATEDSKAAARVTQKKLSTKKVSKKLSHRKHI